MDRHFILLLQLFHTYFIIVYAQQKNGIRSEGKSNASVGGYAIGLLRARGGMVDASA